MVKLRRSNMLEL